MTLHRIVGVTMEDRQRGLDRPELVECCNKENGEQVILHRYQTEFTEWFRVWERELRRERGETGEYVRVGYWDR